MWRLRGRSRLLLCTMRGPPAQAADYPDPAGDPGRRLPPGGPSDVLARILGKKLEQILGQPFVIENRPGAGGNVAAEAVAHAAPDGYTLLNGNNSILATNAALYKKINFDPEEDFAPIGLIGSQANILVVNPAVPANVDGRADRARQGQPRQDQLRLVRPRRGGASRRRAVQGRGQDRHRARALQGRGARPAGRDRRPCADDVRDRGLGGAATSASGKVRALARRPRSSARAVLPGHSRPSTSSASRASTPPPGTAWSRRRRRRRTIVATLIARSWRRWTMPAVQQVARRSRRRHHRRHAGGVRRLHQVRNPEMDRDREGVGREAGCDVHDSASLCE